MQPEPHAPEPEKEAPEENIEFYPGQNEAKSLEDITELPKT